MARASDRQQNRTAAWVGTIVAALMIASQVSSKATRDALFLSEFDATLLPNAMIAAAAVSVIGVLAMSRGLRTFGPARLVPLAFLASGGLFLTEWLLIDRFPKAIAWMVYLHCASFGSIVISGFWSVVNERFDPHSAKRIVARIGIGATAGGVLGGIAAERVASLLDLSTMLAILAGINVVCAAGVTQIGQASTPVARSTEARESGFALLRQMPFLKNLAALVLLVAVAASLFDFAFKAEAAEAYGANERDLMQFFALFYTGTSVLSFLVQTLLAKRSLRLLGIAGTIATLPIATLFLGVLATVIARLWTAVIVRAAETVLANSLYRSGYELLYTPLEPAQKRASKTIIDVAFERLGDAIGSVVVLGILAMLSSHQTNVVLGCAAAAAAAAIFIARRLHHGYVTALAESLRTGVVELDDPSELDATTRKTLSDTTMALDRERLLQQIQQLRDAKGEASKIKATLVSRPSLGIEEGVAQAVQTLISGTTEEIRAILRGPLRAALVSHVIPLLGHRDLQTDAVAALRRVSGRVIGQLVDSLVDDERPFVIRRRIPRVLSASDDPRAIDGLLAGLADVRFEVRYQCVQALSVIKDRNPTLKLDEDVVFGATLRELDVSVKVWERRRVIDEEAEQSEWLDAVVRARLHRGLEHVFTLLSLVLDRDTLQISLRALESDGEALRGTALEYLENVLPEKIRQKLWPHLGEGQRQRQRNRPREKVIEELLRSMDSMEIDRASLTGKPDS
ncbi:MAG: Npt1/Npt2 family nucleotide transporter [Myxococcota bacterium]